MVSGVKTVLDILHVPEKRTLNIQCSYYDRKFDEEKITGKVSVLIHDNGIRTTVQYPGGIRLIYSQSMRNLPRGFGFARYAAAAWVFGKHLPAPIAAYIENQFKKHIKSTSK